MVLLCASIRDCDTLTALTLKSKNHWGYGAAQIEAWRESLTINEDYFKSNKLIKLVINKAIVGYYAYQILNTTTVKLDSLFVDPSYIGRGYGKVLLLDAKKRLKALGVSSITLDADPHAVAFYARFGFKVVGQLESSIANRFLPVMECSDF